MTDCQKKNRFSLLLVAFVATVLGAEEAPPEAIVTLEETVVTAARTDQTLKDIPAHITVFTPADIRRSPARTLDDFLLQVPGFSLFRRSSSMVAHPTTQGVSLRGIGASGASRTLVLLDGMPLNDPFGGWVQWGKVRLQHLERIEVLRGGGAHIWGNYALGGVIHLATPRPWEKTLALAATGGSKETADLDIVATHHLGPVGVGLEGSYFTTGGYPIVRRQQRGAIDVEADSKNTNLRIKLAHQPSENTDLFLHAGVFGEERSNGTPLTQNSTEAGYAGARATLRTAAHGKWTLSGFAQVQEFESVFSSQAADRNSERPALDQFEVPSSAVGASLEWLQVLSGTHLLTAGSDFRRATGETNEDFRNLTDHFTRRRVAGGDQQVVGFYLQDVFKLAPRWQLTTGGRVDRWRSFSGQRREEDLEDPQTLRDDTYPERKRWVFNPKAGLRFHASERFSLRGALYQTFRAPTLNELFRPFRVGNDITEANPNLDPEQLQGAEIGVDFLTPSLRGRLTGYWNQIEDAIFNLTVAGSSTDEVIDPCGFVPEGGSCRQRGNLERTRIRGVETELSYDRGSFWTGSVRYLFTHGEIVRAPDQPALVGKRLPQVPAHRLVLQLGFVHPTLWATIQGRYLSKQYENDTNSIELGDFAVVDLSVTRPLKAGSEVFLRLENLFDHSYAVGQASNGIVSEGAPRLFHGGVRAKF
jgi:outer membrane cobalamin receptor